MGNTKPKLPPLSESNYELWFALLDAEMTARGGQFVLTTTKLDYIRVFPDDAGKWEEYNGRARFLMLEAVNEIDQNAIVLVSSAKEAYDSLRTKYYDRRLAVASSKLKELTNYEKKDEESIQDTWTRLSKLRSDVIAIKPSMKESYDDTELLMRLLDCLPSSYNTTVDTLKARGNVTTLEALRILQDKEGDLKTESGMVAYSRNRYSSKYKHEQRRSRSRSRSETTPRQHLQGRDFSSPQRKSRRKKPGQECFLCGDDYTLKHCDLRALLVAFVKKLRQRKKKGRAYNAESESEDSEPPQEEDDNDDDNEIAALTQELARKLPQTTWIADTGASSHMTDKLDLFRGPLVEMTRRIIKVGGGYLYSSRYGDIEIPGRTGKPITIQRVYYVPNLGANLLSCRRLCTLGLRGEFDIKAIKLFNLRNECVLRARHSEGVYIVEWIDKLPTRVSNTMHSYWANAFWSKDSWNKQRTSTSGKRDKDFVLMHRRFGHMGNEVLRNIHYITDYGPIQLPSEKHICSSC